MYDLIYQLLSQLKNISHICHRIVGHVAAALQFIYDFTLRLDYGDDSVIS